MEIAPISAGSGRPNATPNYTLFHRKLIRPSTGSLFSTNFLSSSFVNLLRTRYHRFTEKLDILYNQTFRPETSPETPQISNTLTTLYFNPLQLTTKDNYHLHPQHGNRTKLNSTKHSVSSKQSHRVPKIAMRSKRRESSYRSRLKTSALVCRERLTNASDSTIPRRFRPRFNGDRRLIIVGLADAGTAENPRDKDAVARSPGNPDLLSRGPQAGRGRGRRGGCMRGILAGRQLRHCGCRW